MALLPKLKIVQSTDCKSFYLNDITGLYNSVTNVGGYGDVNPDVADVTAASVDILLSDGTTLTVNVYPTLPNTDGVLYQVLNTALGLASDAAITDFITNIIYTVSVGVTDYTYTTYDAVLCNVTCCVNTLNATIEFCGDCDCDNPAMDKYLRAFAMLKSISNALYCTPQLPNKAMAILTSLQEYCSQNNGCGCN